MIRMLDIARDEERPAAFLFDQLLHVLSILVFAQIGDEDVRAFPRIGYRDRSTDAAVASGDDRLQAGEAA
jgi:hypothetical protein